MRRLRVFDTQVQYDEIKCDLERTIVKVRENKSVNFKAENYFIATYNVTSTSDTKLFANKFNISQIKNMYIDNVEVSPRRYHTFTTKGEHIIKCVFCDSLTNCAEMFLQCYNLVEFDGSKLDVSNVTDMSNMFHYCSGLTSLDLNGWNTENVTNMSSMFQRCYKLISLNVGSFDLTNVTNMSNMFNEVYSTCTITIDCNYQDKWLTVKPSNWTIECK